MGGISLQYNEQAMQKAMELAKSSQGQQLLNMLQKNHGQILNQAMTQASQGDYAKAQKILSKLLSDPDTRQLLNQLGGQP